MKVLSYSKRVVAGLFFILCSFCCFHLQAQRVGNWELLGVREVFFRVDRDVIPVSLQKGVYKALKLKVSAGTINMHRFIVFFGNGTSKELIIRDLIRRGGETRVMDLPGNSRIIKRVEILYDTKSYSSRKAVVQLWGLH